MSRLGGVLGIVRRQYIHLHLEYGFKDIHILILRKCNETQAANKYTLTFSLKYFAFLLAFIIYIGVSRQCSHTLVYSDNRFWYVM